MVGDEYVVHHTFWTGECPVTMTRLIACIAFVSLALVGCDSDTADGPGPGSMSGSSDSSAINTDALTLATCQQSYGEGVPAFFSEYFACVDVTSAGEGTTIMTDGLPPHASPYYSAGDANYVAWDDRGGSHSKNPNELSAINFSMTVPANPVAKGITIDASMVDNTMNTSDDEYSGGPVGVALNGVVIFAAMAEPGDDLADEAFTFDLYEGHPAGTTYHYHFETPGPLEVLVDRGLSDNAEPGAGGLEIYGFMCDGTLVLGCTELDGSIPDDSDFDAQNGHVHDITDGTTTYFASRYHTHVCPERWPGYPFFPEIAYYETTACPRPGQN
ncbi:MAG: hypothetical protein ACPGU1_13220 [Myxococcota bacterium]